MAGIIHTTVPMRITRRHLLSGAAGVFAGVAASRPLLAQEATPAGGPTDLPQGGPERLASLLRMIPAAFVETASLNGVLFYYADVQGQLEATGVAAFQPGDTSLPPGFADATGVLAMAAPAYQYGLQEEFAQTFGFSPLQAGESFITGTPPHDLTIFRGGFDTSVLPGVWEASGFTREDTAGGTGIWTAGKEGELDISSNIGRYGLGGLNNVTIVGDDTIVFGRYFSDVEAVVGQVANPSTSIIEQAKLAEMLPTLDETTVSAVAMTGAFLNAWSLAVPEQYAALDALFAESAQETGPFPEVEAAMFAITGGALGPGFSLTAEGTPEASPAIETDLAGDDGGIIQVRLDVGSAEAAETAVAAVEYRWNTWNTQFGNEAFADLMTIVMAEPDPVSPSVAAIDFRAVSSNRVWVDMVLRRDVLPFAWAGPLATPVPAATATPAG